MSTDIPTPTPTPNPRPVPAGTEAVYAAAINALSDYETTPYGDLRLNANRAGAKAVTAALEVLDLPGRDARIRAEVAEEIAGKIRAELVCCDMYDQVQSAAKECERRSRLDCIDDPDEHVRNYHAICHWGEASARLAEDHAAAPAESSAAGLAVPAEGSGHPQPSDDADERLCRCGCPDSCTCYAIRPRRPTLPLDTTEGDSDV